MCGIVGMARPPDGPPVSCALIEAMCDVIRHRGPDDQGAYVQGRVGLGMRRLSIIDLDGGRQPVRNEDSSAWLVFNGEIWNYRELRQLLEQDGHLFTSRSDTEVIVHGYEKWGDNVLEHLRGMFAIALWDENRRHLLLARDRLGKKPLYYTVTADGTLVFGSEVKSLLLAPGVDGGPDPQAVADYLTFRYVPGPETIFQGVKKLQPGHRLTWDGGEIRLQEYWDVCYPPAKRGPSGVPALRTEAEYAERLRELLIESVRARLMSDVPLGAMLSGGIDSSLIVGLMKGMVVGPIQTFSVGYAEEQYSELPYARIASWAFGTEHHELIVSCQDMVDNLERCTWHRDEPVSEPAEVPTYLVSRLAREHVKVVLTGEGGDELFAGYPKYAYDRLAPAYRRIPHPVRHHLTGRMVQALPYRYRKWKIAERALGLPDAQRWTSWFSAFDGDEKADLLTPDFRALVDMDSSRLLMPYVERARGCSRLSTMLYADTKTWLPDDLLMKGDKMSMAAGIEARIPFLDHELVEFAAGVPAGLKIRGKHTKYLLKKAFQDILPPDILHRRKAGFSVPTDVWLRGALGEMAQDLLLSTECLQRGYFRREPLERLLTLHRSGRRDYQRQLWTLLSLETWHRTFRNGAAHWRPVSGTAERESR